MEEPVYLLKLELENVRCFGEKETLDLSDGNGNWRKWTVILGDNGTGKTTLLQSMAGYEKLNFLDLTGEEGLINSYIPHIFSKQKSLPYPNNSNPKEARLGLTFFENELNSHTLTTINGTINSSDQSKNIIQKAIVFGYGANRRISNDSLRESRSENSESLFNENAKLINAEEWLFQLDYVASKESDIRAFASNKRNQVKQILIDLLPEIEDIRFTTPTKGDLVSYVEFKTPFGWLSIHQLSLGYKTMVAWMVDLAARMFKRYPDSDNPLAEPAIVLVDEIDLHLHPKWQRKIFDYLSEKFPATQFIVTAHSPLIVQSAPKDANIVVLRKEGDHVVIDNDVESVQDWRLDQIISSDLFGIDSPRGPETEKWLTERKGLLQKEKLNEDEKTKLSILNQRANNLPTADMPKDIEAMEVIRKAAEYLKRQKG